MSHKNMVENKYERFERWLHENHSEFSMVRFFYECHCSEYVIIFHDLLFIDCYCYKKILGNVIID